MKEDRPLWRSASVLSALGALVVLVATDTVLRHAGGKASELTLFVGRFHPLAVHLPIGIILLVGAAEAATLAPRLRPRLDPAIALALPVLVAAAGGSFVLGHLLARSGDFAPGALNVHRRFELFAVVGICLFPLAWAYQERAATTTARWAYRSLLGVTLGVLSLGAHFGGTLTRGDTYLSRYAPGPLKRLLGGASAALPAAPASAKPKAKEPRLFADVVQPLLTERCVSCHGGEKVKGGLRLDSLDAITKGGEDGSVITPGNPGDSPLLERVLLPADDDDHMPPEGKTGLTASEVATLRFWIERGANDTLLVRDLLAPADARAVLEHALSGSAPTPAAPAPPAPSSSAEPHDTKTPTSVAPPGATTAAPGAATAPRPAPTPKSNAPEPAPPSSPTPIVPSASSASTAAGVLADKCEKCHGTAKQKAKLRVDSLDALLAGGKSGPAVVPGKPAASKLIQRVTLPLDNDQHMPPQKEPQLSARELALLSSFIQSLPPTARASPAPAPQASTPTAASHAASPAPQSSAPAPTPTPALASAPTPASAPASTPTSAEPPPPDLLASLPSHLALYPTEVAPLLRQHCVSCHAGKSPAGGLAISTYPALLKGGDTGPAITPGKPDQSLLVQRISVPLDDSDHMPPEGAPQLTPNQIALVSSWVEKDGSADGEVALNTLPAPAVRAIAEHPPARAERDVAAASPRARSGGCGACVVSSREQAPESVAAAAGALILALSRRRRRAHA